MENEQKPSYSNNKEKLLEDEVYSLMLSNLICYLSNQYRKGAIIFFLIWIIAITFFLFVCSLSPTSAIGCGFSLGLFIILAMWKYFSKLERIDAILKYTIETWGPGSSPFTHEALELRHAILHANLMISKAFPKYNIMYDFFKMNTLKTISKNGTDISFFETKDFNDQLNQAMLLYKQQIYQANN